jgi:TetR/AcrR family transcriptional regulator, transcriptional repressor for nem operon
MDAPSPPTRQRIVDAAFELFLHHGYSGTGVNQILQQCGLSKGAFYHHFKSKDEIYAEIIAEFFLKPLEITDFDKMATLSLKDIRTILTDYYAGLPAEIRARGQIDMARYFSLFFEAIARLPDFRQSVQTYYLTLIEVFTTKTYEEREVFPKVAEAHSRNVIATFEGRLLLHAILGDLAPPRADLSAD